MLAWSLRARENASVSIYDKALSELRTSDLEQLLAEGAIENIRLEFKSEAPDKDETLKKLSSFANTFGGFMVVGAKARSADGRLESLPGIDPQSGYKQKLVQWAFEGSTPPFVVEVSDPIPCPGSADKVCYVAWVAESDVAPHFLNGRKGVWVRTDEFSSRTRTGLAEDAELRQLFRRREAIVNRRTALLERSKARFIEYTRNLISTLPPDPKPSPLIELFIAPRFPSRPVCTQDRLKDVVMSSYIQYRGVTFPRNHESIIAQHESVIVPNADGPGSLFELNTWGVVFYSDRLASEQGPNGTYGIHPFEFVGRILLYVTHARGVLQKIKYSGAVNIDVSLASMLSAPWLAIQHFMAYPQPIRQLDNEISFTIETDTWALETATEEVIKDVLRLAFFSANWPDWVDTNEKLEDLLNNAYKFNCWK